MESSARLAVLPLRTCFVNLPLADVQRLGTKLTNVALQLEWTCAESSRSVCVGWGGAVSAGVDLEVSAVLAEALDLRPRLVVQVRVVELQLAASISLEPETLVDWQLAQQEASQLEDKILTQVLVLNKGQRLPLWLNGNQVIWFRVAETLPTAPAVRLSAGTEVQVAPFVQAQEKLSVTRSVRLRVQACEAFTPPREIACGEFDIGLQQSCMRHLGVRTGHLLLLYSKNASGVPPHDERRAAAPGRAFGFAVEVEDCAVPFAHVSLSSFLRLQLGCETGSNIRVRAMSGVAHLPREDSCFRLCVHQLVETGRVTAGATPPDNDALLEQVKRWLSQTGCPSIPMPEYALVRIEGSGLVQIRIADNKPADGGDADAVDGSNARLDQFSALNLSRAPPTFINPAAAVKTEGQIIVGTSKLLVNSRVQALAAELQRIPRCDFQRKVPNPRRLAGRAKDVANARSHVIAVLNCLSTGAELHGLMGLLLQGRQGIGKSVIAEAVGHAVALGRGGGRDLPLPLGASATAAHRSMPPRGHTLPPVWVGVLRGEALVGVQPAVSLARIRAALARAAACAPALLIIDDLNLAFPDSADSSNPNLSVLAEAAAEIFASFAHDCRRPAVAFLATTSVDKPLHRALCASGLFDTTFSLAAPDASQRRKVVQQLALHRDLDCSAPVLRVAASVSEGLVASDLVQLIEGAAIVAAARLLLPHGTTEPEFSLPEGRVRRLQLAAKDIRAALSHVVTARGSSSGLSKADGPAQSAESWADLGGLEQVKRVLHEAVLLPYEQPELFAGAPLRLTSGLLLYGPSGCGKTLAVRSLAAESGLPFLAVKGPELLNKYIGASEAAVRQLFERAVNCSPCIIFLDEFEAIAPRRGQDATGVTDRVVNQLLCQLDGVEALHGVFVIAASNRPELIDPALLRPGRLDRKVFFPIPNITDRIAILASLCRHVPVAAELTSLDALTNYAARCEGFTGADLQALLYAAHLNAIHEELLDQEKMTPNQLDDLKHVGLTMDDQSVVRAAYNGRSPWLYPPDLWCRIDANERQTPSSAPSLSPDVQPHHLEAALGVARPSIPAKERLHRDSVYEAFRGADVERTRTVSPFVQHVTHF